MLCYYLKLNDVFYVSSFPNRVFTI
ncbi:hypothetical protein CY0110_19542 [Crocosphaera chwakensis CCY0110]|uniref:Uncharacterized protein n=1 Tax=Crocosphaera chwakensis CCY0110 TaxID=391612 RepID=A3IJP0_9CHRO|nr:hypothetical protein CY0110_19542 [Crocosphaera chwakensis CCY0110]